MYAVFAVDLFLGDLGDEESSPQMFGSFGDLTVFVGRQLVCSGCDLHRREATGKLVLVIRN